MSDPHIRGLAGWVHGGVLKTLKTFGDSAQLAIYRCPEGLDYEREMIPLYMDGIPKTRDAEGRVRGSDFDALMGRARRQEDDHEDLLYDIMDSHCHQCCPVDYEGVRVAVGWALAEIDELRESLGNKLMHEAHDLSPGFQKAMEVQAAEERAGRKYGPVWKAAARGEFPDEQ